MTLQKNFPGGVLLLDKPQGITSHDAVGLARRAFGTRQVGHTGTLDPLATGLLCVLVGRAVKASDLISGGKRYTARIKFGFSTDTGDVTGHTIESGCRIPELPEVLSAVEKFPREYGQIPPMYSAIKVEGKKLYELARKGVTVERNPRPVSIYSMSAAATEESDEFELDVECSAGTYIRTLCEDLARSIGTCATMSALRRTAACGFEVSRAVSPERLAEAAAEGKAEELLMPLDFAFSELPALRVPAFYERLLRNGCRVETAKLPGVKDAAKGRIRLYSESGEFFAIGETLANEDGIKRLRCVKLFVI